MTSDQMKKAAAEAAMAYVQPGIKLGLGTGSTVQYFIAALGAKVKQGLEVLCVPTSNATAKQAQDLGIPLTTLEQHSFLDMTVDGADEFDGDFNLIKGGGGALLLEKIVASSSRQMMVIADKSKQVKTLGKVPLPIELVPFGVKATAWKIERALKYCGLKGSMVLRVKDGKPFRTEGGHVILDVSLGAIPDARKLSRALSMVPGVVDHGLFLDLCGVVLVGTAKGVEKIIKPPRAA